MNPSTRPPLDVDSFSMFQGGAIAPQGQQQQNQQQQFGSMNSGFQQEPTNQMNSMFQQQQ